MSVDLSSYTDAITRLLQAEYQLTTQLFEMLMQEHQALESFNIDKLPNITQSKNDKLRHLDQCTQEREKLMRLVPENIGGGLHPDLTKFVAQSAPEIQSIWELFKEALANCQRQNMVNGRIIQLNQQSIERSLNIIRSTQDTAKTYDLKGNQKSAGASNHVIKV
jgi:flagellar biosynthesis protein FlgN